jgi:hypothetical protein
MKRLLLFLCVVGAGLYSLGLVPNPEPNSRIRQSSTAVVENDSQQDRQLGSWGATLQSLTRAPRYQRVAGGEPPTVSLAAQDVLPAVPQPPSSPNSADEPTERIWGRITLAARVHTEASVSSPTVRFYPAGSEVQVLGQERGWFEIADPVTQEQGWVFEKYLVAIAGPPSAETKLVTIAAQPAADAALKPRRPGRSVKGGDRVAERATNVERRLTRRGDRKGILGLFSLRKRATSAAWTVGPAQ